MQSDSKNCLDTNEHETRKGRIDVVMVMFGTTVLGMNLQRRSCE